MKKQMLINVLQPEETRIAILEENVLEELYVERVSNESYVGNIYRGRVVNIEPSIQAAFVDFGVGRNGFLHISDIDPSYFGGERDDDDQPRGRGNRSGGPSRQGGRESPREPSRESSRGERRGRSDEGRRRRRGPKREEPSYADDVPEELVTSSESLPDLDDLRFDDFPSEFEAPSHSESSASEPDAIESDPLGGAASRRASEPAFEEFSSFGEDRAVEEKPARPSDHRSSPPAARSAPPPTPAPPPSPTPPVDEEDSFGEGLLDDEQPPLDQRGVFRKTEPGDDEDPFGGGLFEEDRSEPPNSFKPSSSGGDDDEEGPEPRQERFDDDFHHGPNDLEDRTSDPEDLGDDNRGNFREEPYEPQGEAGGPRRRRRRRGGRRRRGKDQPEESPPSVDADSSDWSDDAPPISYREPDEENLSFSDEETLSARDDDEFDEPQPPQLRSEPRPAPRGRDDRGRDDRGRGDRGRDDRGRSERGRDDRGRDDRGRDDRGRDDRGRGRSHEDRGPRRADERSPRREEDHGRDPLEPSDRSRPDDRPSPPPRERETRHEEGDRGPRHERRDGGRDHRGPRGNGRPPFRGNARRPRERPPIQEILKRGQEVLVQVIKEGIGNKGPTLSTYVSIPGRYLVLMPGLSRVGVSRKIIDEEQRRKLKEIVNELERPPGVGFIIRTAGLERTKKELEKDLAYLLRLWEVVQRRINSQRVPAVIYQESDMIIRTIRDIFTSEIDEIVIDEPNAFARAKEFLDIVMPKYSDRLRLHDHPEPLFHHYGIEDEIALIQERQVPLPNGGSIVVDQTEALVAIDVNSGNFRTEGDAEETAYRINLAAAKEIARQLRLRDLGGVIVNDFIDMREERHRRAVEQAMRDAVKRDRARTKILRMSAFGIIEMTRQRIRPSLRRSLYRECPVCRGSGIIKTVESLAIESMRLLWFIGQRGDIARIEVSLSHEVSHYLQNHKRRHLAEIEERFKLVININSKEMKSPQDIFISCYTPQGDLINVDVDAHR